MAKSGARGGSLLSSRPLSKSPSKTSSRGKRGQFEARGALQLDRLIHEQARLAIVSALAASQALTFRELKEFLRLTDGNLSVHCRKLEAAGYIDCDKTFERRVPKTTYRLTEKGRKALKRYLSHMEALIEAIR